MPDNISSGIGFISGMTAGLADAVINYPAYSIKLNLQLSNSFSWKMFYPKELYRGLLPYSASSIPATIIQDGISTVFSTCLPDNASSCHYALGAFIGGILGAFVATPINNVIVAQKNNKSNPKTAVRTIFQSNGFPGFFRGLLPTISREAIYSTVTFWGVQAAKKSIVQKHNFGNSNETIANITASILTGVPATIVSQPFDTLATRIQDDKKNDLVGIKKATEILKKEGIKSLYKGVYARGFSVVCGVFVMSSTSEQTKKFLTEKKEINKIPNPDFLKK